MTLNQDVKEVIRASLYDGLCPPESTNSSASALCVLLLNAFRFCVNTFICCLRCKQAICVDRVQKSDLLQVENMLGCFNAVIMKMFTLKAPPSGSSEVLKSSQ